MSALKMKGDQNIIKGKLKQKRASQAHDGLQYVAGKSEEFLSHLQKQTDDIHEAVKESVAGRGE